MSFVDKFNLLNEFNILRIICAVFFIPHIIGKFTVPLRPMLLDLMLVLNLAIAAIVLVSVMFVTSPLELSIFPSLLLGTTLFRLVLNVASTAAFHRVRTASSMSAS